MAEWEEDPIEAGSDAGAHDTGAGPERIDGSTNSERDVTYILYNNILGFCVNEATRSLRWLTAGTTARGVSI